jgi:hypothetical protein
MPKSHFSIPFSSGFTGVLLLLLLITFMHGVYSYIPETNHVLMAHSVAAICVKIYGTDNVMFHVTFCTFTLVPSKVQYVCSAKCISLISFFPVLLLGNCLNNFEMVPVAPIITGITFVLYTT